MTNRAIEFENARFCYGDVCAIHDVTFSIPKRKLTALVGPNGGGKSTIIKLLSGFLKADDGKVEVIDNAPIGYVAQSFGFDSSFPITVIEAVLTGTLDKKIKPFRKYSKEQRQKALDAMDEVGLEGFENRGINQLSGGQLRRVVIARALAAKAEILVLDEPDSNLDAEATNELYNLLNELKKTKTILVASHQIDYLLDISDTAIYVNETTKKYDNPKELKSKLKEDMAL